MDIRNAFKKLAALGKTDNKVATPDDDAGRKILIASTADGLTPKALTQVLRDAENGKPEKFFKLASEMEERDPHYGAVLQIRKLAVLGTPPEIVAASTGPKDEEIAQAVREDIIDHPEFSLLLADCLDALGKGISAVEIEWSVESATRWKPSKFDYVEPAWLVFDKETGKELRLKDKDQKDGKPLDYGKFIVHGPRMKSGKPIKNGLALLAIWSWMFKNYTVKDWAHFCEVFGQPMRIGRYGPNTNDKDKRTLLRGVNNIARGMGIVIPQSSSIELIAPKNSSNPPFLAFAKYLDGQMSKAVLGQTMTTDDGSSQAQAKVHNEVRRDISLMDATQLAATINRDLIRPYVKVNFGPDVAPPRFKIDIAEPEDLEKLIKIAETLTNMGVALSVKELRDRFGWLEPNEDELTVGGTAKGDTKLEKNSLELNRAHLHREDDELDVIAAMGLDGWSAQGDPILEPVKVALNSASSIEEFMDSLPSILDRQDAGPLVDALAQATLKARAQGDAGNLDG
jgi:phage gp29-like protein